MDQSANHILLRSGQPGAADRMRELLASTVPDVSDPRSHASALEGIRRHLEGLEWLVEEVRERELAGLAGQLADARETLRAQEQWLSRLQQNDVKLQQSMEAAPGRFSRLGQAIAGLSQRADDLNKEMSAVKGRIDQGFGTQASTFAHSMAAVSATLEQGLAGLAAKIDGLAGRVSGLAGQVDLAGCQVQVAHGRLERLDERLGDIDDRIGAVDSKLAGLDTKLSGTDGKVGALANRIDRLGDRIDDTDDRIGLINERIASVEARMAAGRREGERIRLPGQAGLGAPATPTRSCRAAYWSRRGRPG
jgi:chromosome segregation ATPase